MKVAPAWVAGGAVLAALAGATTAATPGTGWGGACATALGLLAVTCGSAALRRRSWRWGSAAAGAALVAGRLAIGFVTAAPTAAQPVALPHGNATWEASVESAARSSRGGQSLVLRVSNPQFLCFASLVGYEPLETGSAVAMMGSVTPPPAGDFGAYLSARGLDGVCEVRDLRVIRTPSGPAASIERLRQASGDALARALPEPAAGLAAGILIGLRDRVDRDVAASFTTAGVSHIVAISGWNIAIVAGVVAAMTRGAGRRRRAALTVAAVVAYTCFAGASPSVVRAALMASAALLAAELGGRIRASVALAWATTAMLIVAPSTAADVGFQLSAAATAGLIAWGSACTAVLERRASWLPGMVRESLGVSFAAQLATLPIVLIAFGRLALISPLVNLATVPLVPVAMAAGVVALLAGFASHAGGPTFLLTPLSLPAWAVLSVLITLVRLGAAAPGASILLPPPLNWAVAIAVFGAIGRVAAVRHGPVISARDRPPPRKTKPARRGPPRWIAVAVAMLVALAGCVVVVRPDSSVHVVVFDVGQGDAILVEGNRGSRILIDGGPDPGRAAGLLDRRLPAWSRRLDGVILTHPHDDHVVGLAEVVRRFDVGHVFESGVTAATPGFRGWRNALAARRIVPETLARGQRLTLDDATLEVLWPSPEAVACASSERRDSCGDAESANRAVNDSSIVLLGRYAGRAFLLTGDAEDDVDPALLGRGLPPLDLLKVAHHGSATATSQALVDATRPALAVVSVGKDNKYGHPNAATLGRLESSGARVLRTDRAGTIDTVIDAGSVRLAVGSGAAGVPAADPGGAVGPPALLYDSADVDPKPFRERAAAALAPSPSLASSPLSRGRRGRGMARARGGASRRTAFPRPRRVCRAPP